MKTKKITLLFTLVGALLLLAMGCSVKNPNDSFNLLVEGSFEKAIMDSLQTSATGLDTTLVTNQRLIGTSSSDETNATGVIVVPLSMTLARSIAALLHSGSSLIQIISGSVINNSTNSLDFFVYLDTSSTYGTGISARTSSKICSLHVNVGTSSEMLENGTYFNTTFNSSMLGSRNNPRLVFLYLVVIGNPTADLTIETMRLTVPPNIAVIGNVTPNDVSQYTLEDLSEIGLGGTIRAGAGSANNVDSLLVTFACKSGTGTDTTITGLTTIGSVIARRTDYTTNGFIVSIDSLSSQILGNATGRAALMARFRELFPPTSLGSFFRVDITAYHRNSSQVMPFHVNDLRIITNAQVRRN